MLNLLFHSAFFNAPVFLTLALVAVLLAAAVYDIKSYTIPHVFSYLVIALFVVNAVTAGASFTALSWHVLSVIIAFAIGFILFIFKLMGGGDVKLFAALALWFFPLGLIGLVFSITTVGVGISLGIAGVKMVATPAKADRDLTFSDRLNSARKARIPYGPAIAIGTLVYLILSSNLGF